MDPKNSVIKRLWCTFTAGTCKRLYSKRKVRSHGVWGGGGGASGGGYDMDLENSRLSTGQQQAKKCLSTSTKCPGPSCSKLTMSLVNDLLKFTSSDTQICRNVLLKKM